MIRNLLYRIARRVARAAEPVAPARVTMPLVAWADKVVEPKLCMIPKLVKCDQIAVDVGAASGCYSYYLSRFARTCHAFEPNPDSVERPSPRCELKKF